MRFVKRLAFALVTIILLPINPLVAPPAFADAPWLTRLDDAVEQAARDDRYILVDLYAEWCGWCQVLEQKVFSTAEFREFANDFVLLRVDTQDGGEGTRLRTQYRAKTLPTVLVLDARRIKIGAVSGVAPTAEFIASIESEIQRFAFLVKAYDKARKSDKIDLQRQLAEEFHRRVDGLRAAALYEQVLRQTTDGSGEAAWLLYHIADSLRLGGGFDQARQNLSRARVLAASLGDENLLERVDFLSYYIARNAGDCKTAAASLERYLDRHPHSESSPKARRFLAEIKYAGGVECS